MEQAALPQAVRFILDGSPERSSVKRVQPACAELLNYAPALEFAKAERTRNVCSMSVGPPRFWKAVDTAPFDAAVRIIVASRLGEHFLLPYLCRQTTTGWTNALTGAPLALRPTHWREAQRGERTSERSANTASTSSFCAQSVRTEYTDR
jgi:hypothetical protein